MFAQSHGNYHYLSGAGPAILALATHSFDKIAQSLIAILRKAQDIDHPWWPMELAEDGATIQRTKLSNRDF